MAKTFDELNDKTRAKQAVVVTAEEMNDIVREKGRTGGGGAQVGNAQLNPAVVALHDLVLAGGP